MAAIFKVIQAHLYNVIGAVVLLLIGLILGLLAKRILRKVLHEFELDLMVKKLGKDYSLEQRLSSLAAYVIYFIFIVWALNFVGVTSVVLYILLGGVVLLIGLTILLGIKDFVPNLIGGLTVYRQGYQVGKKIKVNDIEGKIEKLGMLEMEIKTKNGEKIYLPNSLLVKSKVLLK